MIDVNEMVGWQDILSAAEKNEKLTAPHFAYDMLAYSALRMVMHSFNNGEFSEAGKNKLVSSVFNTWCQAAQEMNEALEAHLVLEVVNETD